MNEYKPYKKGTLLIDSGPTGKHLYFIATDVCDDGCHLLVNISTLQSDKDDQTCVLVPGCHPFVIANSYVKYRMAEIQPADRIARMVAGWVWLPKEDCSDDVIDQIAAGFVKSPHTPQRIVNYFMSVTGTS